MMPYCNYSKFATLKNGKRVEIRLPREEDRSGLISFLERTPKKDVQFCKDDLRDFRIVDSWLGNQHSQRGIFLVAMDLEDRQLVAGINLLCGRHADHKVGEIRHILVDQPFQGLGLGGLLLDCLIYLAAVAKLNWLKAEVATDLKLVVKAFECRGFQAKALLEDYFVDHLGKSHDVTLMVLPLQRGAQI